MCSYIGHVDAASKDKEMMTMEDEKAALLAILNSRFVVLASLVLDC